ncbi:MAG: hypothetical protein WC654_08105 [Patescibacteria group bacterium]
MDSYKITIKKMGTQFSGVVQGTHPPIKVVSPSIYGVMSRLGSELQQWIDQVEFCGSSAKMSNGYLSDLEP